MMNWKGSGRKRPWPDFKLLSLHSSGGTEEEHKNPVKISGLRAEIEY
jgi:hypothetical protein